MEQQTYSLKELCKTTNVTERTVRYYIKEGLLPSPSGSGPFSRYSYEHWLRLTLIRRLKEEFLPLHEIKNQLNSRSLTELTELARSSGLLPDQPPAASPSHLTLLLRPDTLRQQLNPPSEHAPPPPHRPLLIPRPPTNSPSVVMRFPGSPANNNNNNSHLVLQPPIFQPNDEEPELLGDSWERVSLAPGVELHVQREVIRRKREQLEALLKEAKKLLED